MGTGGGGKPLYTQTFNLATRATVTANATCGEIESGQEMYCKYGGGGGGGVGLDGQQCGVCDARSSDPAKNHGPANAVDSSMSTWWQSPSLHNGDRYQYVTFTVDLKQVRTRARCEWNNKRFQFIARRDKITTVNDTASVGLAWSGHWFHPCVRLEMTI